MKAIYINRSDIGWYSTNSNVFCKALEMVTKYEATLCVSRTCIIPAEINDKAKKVVRFNNVFDLLRMRELELIWDRNVRVFTGFDFPCMEVALVLKRRHNCQWTVFCWDPPSLSHRDRFPPLRWAIDFLFRRFVRQCDHFVLNIHPGLLDEAGFSRNEIEKWARSGKLELRMQDAFENVLLPPVHPDEGKEFDYDIGVLSNWAVAKGGELLANALRSMSERTCLWIGDPPTTSIACPQITFSGRLEQREAFSSLKRCRLLLAPYLPVRSLKWNYALKLFEYLQMGRPILASDNPGNLAVAKKFPGRIELFKSGDVKDLVCKIAKMI